MSRRPMLLCALGVLCGESVRAQASVPVGVPVPLIQANGLTCGVEITGYDNSNRPLQLFQNLNSHHSDTQFKPAAWPVAASQVTGNGAVCTATVGAPDPRVGVNGQRLSVGSPVAVSGMSDAAADCDPDVQASRCEITALTGSSVSYPCTLNGTAGGGSLRSARFRWERLAVGASFQDAVTSCPVYKVLTPANYTPSPTTNVRWRYSSGNFINRAGNKMLVWTGSHNAVVFSLQTLGQLLLWNNGNPDNARSSKASYGGDDPSDYYYSASGSGIVRIHRYSLSQSGTTNGRTDIASIGGVSGCSFTEAGVSLGNDGKDKLVMVCGAAVYFISVDSRTSAIIFPGYSSSSVDNAHPTPSNNVVIVHGGDGAALNQGLELVNGITGLSIRHVSDRRGHGDVNLSKEGDEVFAYESNTQGSGVCPGNETGLIMVRLSDSQKTCIWSRADAGALDGQGQGGGHAGSEVPGFIVLSLMCRDSERGESLLAASWDTGLGRGCGSVILCELSNSTSRKCWLLAATRSASHIEVGGSFYKMPKAGTAMLEANAPPGYVPWLVCWATDGLNPAVQSPLTYAEIACVQLRPGISP